jgi:hypothetical protein
MSVQSLVTSSNGGEVGFLLGFLLGRFLGVVGANGRGGNGHQASQYQTDDQAGVLPAKGECAGLHRMLLA